MSFQESHKIIITHILYADRIVGVTKDTRIHLHMATKATEAARYCRRNGSVAYVWSGRNIIADVCGMKENK